LKRKHVRSCGGCVEAIDAAVRWQAHACVAGLHFKLAVKQKGGRQQLCFLLLVHGCAVQLSRP